MVVNSTASVCTTEGRLERFNVESDFSVHLISTFMALFGCESLTKMWGKHSFIFSINSNKTTDHTKNRCKKKTKMIFLRIFRNIKQKNIICSYIKKRCSRNDRMKDWPWPPSTESGSKVTSIQHSLCVDTLTPSFQRDTTVKYMLHYCVLFYTAIMVLVQLNPTNKNPTDYEERRHSNPLSRIWQWEEKRRQKQG